MDLLFILIGAGLAIFVIFVSYKSIGAGIAAKSEINRQKDKASKEEEILKKLKNKNLGTEILKRCTTIFKKIKKTIYKPI